MFNSSRGRPPGKLPRMDLGLHESLVTRELASRLAELTGLEADIGQIDDADAPHVFARHVQQVVERQLEATKGPERRLALVNSILQTLDEASAEVSDPASQLLRLVELPRPGSTPMADVRPATPLSDAALLTNAKGEPSLGAELRAEIDTADEVDLLCAFVKWHGLRLLEPELAPPDAAPSAVPRHHHDLHGRHRARCPRPAGPRVRRRGARSSTTPSAPDCTPRRGCSAGRRGSTRRTSGRRTSRGLRCSTAWSGTSACRGSAHPACWRSSARPSTPTGTTLASSPTTPTATATASTTRSPRPPGDASTSRVTISLSGLEVRPYPYQQQMLEALEVERERPRPPPQPGRRRHRHRQDRGRGARLPRPVRCREPASARRCCSSPTARRSSSSRCGPTARCSPTRTSASSTSAAPGPSAGSTSSPACSR